MSCNGLITAMRYIASQAKGLPVGIPVNPKTAKRLVNKGWA